MLALALAAPAGAQNPATAPAAVPSNPVESKLSATPAALQKIDVKQGNGATAVAGKPVLVHYTGWLYDAAAPANHGAKFDSSRDRGVPFGFILGAGKVGSPGTELEFAL